LARLLPGENVVVTEPDRLGRSTLELLELIERIGKAGSSFRSFAYDDKWLVKMQFGPASWERRPLNWAATPHR
jgi:Resolvase, N terminal domain